MSRSLRERSSAFEVDASSLLPTGNGSNLSWEFREETEFGGHTRSDGEYLRGRIATPHFSIPSGACLTARLTLQFGVTWPEQPRGLCNHRHSYPANETPPVGESPDADRMLIAIPRNDSSVS